MRERRVGQCRRPQDAAARARSPAQRNFAAVDAHAGHAPTTMSLARPVERLANRRVQGRHAGTRPARLVHEIEQLVASAADDVKAAQSALENPSPPSPAEPLRHLISVCFYIFARGARQTLYTTVGSLLRGSARRTRRRRPSRPRWRWRWCSATLAASTARTWWLTRTRSACSSCRRATRRCCSASRRRRRRRARRLGRHRREGAVELLKNLKAVLGERSVLREIKAACLRALPPFQRNAEGLWHGEVLDGAAALRQGARRRRAAVPPARRARSATSSPLPSPSPSARARQLDHAGEGAGASTSRR